jgi:hypothetical protein
MGGLTTSLLTYTGGQTPNLEFKAWSSTGSQCYKSSLSSDTGQGALQSPGSLHARCQVGRPAAQRHSPASQSTAIPKSTTADGADECSTIDGITVPQNSESQQLTTFTNEACSAVEVRGKYPAQPSSFYTDPVSINELKMYLARPTKFANGTLPSLRSEHPNFFLNSVTFAQHPYFNKLAGSYGMRFTWCFRLEVAATPFVGGLYALAFCPFGNDGGDFNRLFTNTTALQLPHVRLDINEATAVEFRVPFIHFQDYFVYGSVWTLGEMALFTFSEVNKAVGVSVPQFTIWHWFEDVELIAATPLNTTVIPTQLPVIAPASDTITFQSGLATTEFSKSTPVATALSLASSSMRFLGKGIPAISSVTGIASWAFGAGSKLAHAFGWSKPLVSEPITRVVATDHTFEFNMDGTDAVYTLGASCLNTVAPMTGFAGTDVDEMAIPYVIGQYGMIQIQSLQNINQYGQICYSCDCTPLAMYFQSPVNPYNKNLGFTGVATTNGVTFFPSSLFAVAQTFNLWRGGFKFRLSIAKTKFHTGRYMLAYNPQDRNTRNTGVAPNISISPLSFINKIWDLRESGVMEFEIPFISPVSYLTMKQSIGTFSLICIEPLSGPDSVALTVPVVVEVCAASDFELADPTGGYYPASPQIQATILAQSGIDQIEFQSGIPFSQNSDPAAAVHCIGEKVNSIKQLINIGCFYKSVNTAPATGVGNSFDVLPWFISTPNTWTTPNPTSLTTYYPGYCQYYNKFYKLARGGTCVDTIPGVSYAGASNVQSITSFFNDKDGTGVRDTNPFCTGLITETGKALHAKLPYYSPLSRCPHQSGETTNRNYPSVIARVITSNSNCLVRAADDSQLGYYIGPPPLCYPYANTFNGFAPFNSVAGSVVGA